MTRQIKRRDFLNGVAIGAGGLLLAGRRSGTEASAKASVGAPRRPEPRGSRGLQQDGFQPDARYWHRLLRRQADAA